MSLSLLMSLEVVCSVLLIGNTSDRHQSSFGDAAFDVMLQLAVTENETEHGVPDCKLFLAAKLAGQAATITNSLICR